MFVSLHLKLDNSNYHNGYVYHGYDQQLKILL